MLSRGRPCLKRRGISTVWDNLASSSDEPLFFLYPRWFTSRARPHSFSLQSPASTRYSGTRRSTSRASRRPRKQSFGSTSRRWINSDSAVSIEADGTKKATTTQDEASTTASDNSLSKGTEDLDGDVMIDAEQTPETPSPPSLDEPTTPSFNLFDSLEEELAAMTPPLLFTDEPTMSIYPTDSWSLEQVQVPSVPPRELAGSDRWSYRDNQAFLQQRIRAREARFENKILVKWEVVREYLGKLQRESLTWPKKPFKREMLVPEETVALLVGAIHLAGRENIFYVPVLHGCKVQVLHSIESEGQCRKLLLSGSDRVVELVCDRINKARILQENGDPVVGIRKPIVPVFPSMMALKRDNITPPVIRGVWDLINAKKWPKPIHIVNRGKENLSTLRDFAEYIEDLVHAEPAQDGQGEDNKTISHRSQVADALVEVFQVNSYERLISTAALNTALDWMYKYGFLQCINPVLYKAQHVATVDTFNILLKWMAKRQDSNAFHHYLTLMFKAKIPPNEETWLALLSSVVDARERAEVMEWMNERGYLTQDGSKRKGLKLTVRESLLTHLESGRDIDSFFNEILGAQGTHWFSPSLTSKMFSVVCRRKDFKAMDRLLDICRQQNLETNSDSIRYILQALSPNISLTLQYLYRCGPGLERKLREDTWETLFFTASQGQNYNACRVIWRYACIYKGVTYRMRQAVLMSLAGNKDGPDDFIWHFNAGKVIVGLDLHLPGHIEDIKRNEILKKVPPEFHSNPVALLASASKPENPMPLAKTLIWHDITVGPSYRPTHNLLSKLTAAAKMDHVWQSASQPTTWLMQNAIDVPVEATSATSSLAA